MIAIVTALAAYVTNSEARNRTVVAKHHCNYFRHKNIIFFEYLSNQMIDNLIAAKFRRPLKVLGTSTFNIPTFFKIQIEIEFHF